MSEAKKYPPVLSPVDYEAWYAKGYHPPSEHVLIDALSFRGAKVIASSSMIQGEGWWIVIQGDPFACEDSIELMMMAAKNQARYSKERRLKTTTAASEEAAVAPGDQSSESPMPQPTDASPKQSGDEA